MVPWEFDLVVTQTNSWVKEESEKQKMAMAEREATLRRTIQQKKKR
jgi:hypothetical protein